MVVQRDFVVLRGGVERSCAEFKHDNRCSESALLYRLRVVCALVTGGLCPGYGWFVPGLRVGLRMAKAQVDEGITARVPLDPAVARRCSEVPGVGAADEGIGSVACARHDPLVLRRRRVLSAEPDDHPRQPA